MCKAKEPKDVQGMLQIFLEAGGYMRRQQKSIYRSTSY